MALIVQKYGGTSVGSVERIEAVAERVAWHHSDGDQLIIVVSAMSGETNRLLGLARDLTSNPSPRELDILVSTGQQVSMALLAMALHKRGIDALSLKGSQVAIRTDSFHSKARIQSIDDRRLRAELDQGRVAVVAGFQGVDENGEVTTLGRGGSDTSAVALAVALDANECQIYTDVDGVYTTDPHVYDKAKKIDKLSFEEMLELSSLGAKVLQIRSVEFASKFNMPIRVLSSFNKGEGTLIDKEDENLEEALISGVTHTKNDSKLIIRQVPDVPGIAAKILSPISKEGIEVDVIVQNVAEEKTTDFTFTVKDEEAEKAAKILNDLSDELGGGSVELAKEISKVSVVGVGMKSHAGVAAKMFSALADKNINIDMISTSEIKISVVVSRENAEDAVKALHDAFELG